MAINIAVGDESFDEIRQSGNRRVMIIEAKKADTADRMEKCCDEALKQIIDGEYAKNLETGYKELRHRLLPEISDDKGTVKYTYNLRIEKSMLGGTAFCRAFPLSKST